MFILLSEKHISIRFTRRTESYCHCPCPCRTCIFVYCFSSWSWTVFPSHCTKQWCSKKYLCKFFANVKTGFDYIYDLKKWLSHKCPWICNNFFFFLYCNIFFFKGCLWNYFSEYIYIFRVLVVTAFKCSAVWIVLSFCNIICRYPWFFFVPWLAHILTRWEVQKPWTTVFYYGAESRVRLHGSKLCEM